MDFRAPFALKEEWAPRLPENTPGLLDLWDLSCFEDEDVPVTHVCFRKDIRSQIPL